MKDLFMYHKEKFLTAAIFLFGLVQISFAQQTEYPLKTYYLDEVVITATKTPHKLKDVPIETILITKEDIENSNSKNVSKILRDISGFNIRGENVPGSSAYQSTLRGLDFDKAYVLVLINGERILGGGMGEYGVSVNQLPVEMIERIEIIKGPASALYGSDAIGGVVNIITKPIPEKPLFTSSVGRGEYDTYLAGISCAQQIGKFGFLANFSREGSKRGRYSASEDDFTGEYAHTKFQYKISSSTTLNLGVNYDALKWEYSTEKKSRISPSFETTFSDESVFKLKAYYYNLNFDLFSPGYTRRFGDIIFTQIEPQYTRPFGKKHVLTTGIECLNRDVDIDVSTDTFFVDKKTDLISFYLQDEINLSPFNIVLGGRVDLHSVYGIEYNPKISAMWNISDNTRLRLSTGRAFKSPTIRQLYVFFKHGNWWNKPNENLEPEKSWGYSVGLEQVLKNLHTNLSIFRNDINDIIAQVETDEKIDNAPVKIWENYQKAYTQGMELGINAFIFKTLSINLGYTYLDAKNLDTDKRLPFTSEHIKSVGINYKISPWKLSFHWNTNYYSPCFSDATNTKKIIDYSISGFKFTKGITDKLDFSFEIDNIFESNYGEPNKPWLGRTIFGKLFFKL